VPIVRAVARLERLYTVLAQQQHILGDPSVEAV
jgi:hypothetical protein